MAKGQVPLWGFLLRHMLCHDTCAGTCLRAGPGSGTNCAGPRQMSQLELVLSTKVWIKLVGVPKPCKVMAHCVACFSARNSVRLHTVKPFRHSLGYYAG